MVKKIAQRYPMNRLYRLYKAGGLLCDNTSAKHISDIMKAGQEDYLRAFIWEFWVWSMQEASLQR